MRENYLCCDRFLTEVGVVHPLRSEPGRPHPVILLGEGGRVYLFWRDDESLHLLSPRGFVEFCDRGLSAFVPFLERCSANTSLMRNEVVREFVDAKTLADAVAARDRHLGYEVTVEGDECDSVSAFIVCDFSVLGYDDSYPDAWARNADSHRVEVLMCARRREGGIPSVVPILTDDVGRFFAIDSLDNRAHFLAKDAETFFRVGFLRFHRSFRYYRGCYSASDIDRTCVKGVGSAYRPSDCSRGVFCRKGEVKSSGSLSRCYWSLRRACQKRR